MIDYHLLEAIRLNWPICQVLKVVFKRSRVIRILWHIIFKHAYLACQEAGAALNTVPQDVNPINVQNVLSFTRCYQAFFCPFAKSQKWCLRGPKYNDFMVDLLATRISNMSGGRRQDKKLNLVLMLLENLNIIYSRLSGLFETSAMS
jgi:hypothetical protein